MADFTATGALLLNGATVDCFAERKSVKTLIIRNVIAACAAIAPTAGAYTRTVRTTSRMSLNNVQPKHDTVYVLTITETTARETESAVEKLLTVRLVLIAQDRRDMGKAVDDLIADVTKALAVDETRGGNAINTTVVRHEDGTIEDNEPTASSLVDVEIRYRHKWGNPYRKA